MTNLITIENAHAVVELSTITKFSETDDKSLQKLLLTYRDTIEEFGEISNLSTTFKVHESGTNKGKINWSKVVLNEQQTYFVLTLLKNSEHVVKFKETLIKQFFKMRDEVMFIREQAIREDAQKKIAKVIEDSKKVNLHSDGTTSITGLIQHYGFEESFDYIKDALLWKEVISTKIKVTTKSTMNDEYLGMVYTNKTFSKDGVNETRDYAYFPQAVRAIIEQFKKAGSPDVRKGLKEKIRTQLEEYLEQ